MQILDRKCILDNLLSLLGFDFLYYFCCGSPETLEITSRFTQSRTILSSSQQKKHDLSCVSQLLEGHWGVQLV